MSKLVMRPRRALRVDSMPAAGSGARAVLRREIEAAPRVIAVHRRGATRPEAVR